MQKTILAMAAVLPMTFAGLPAQAFPVGAAPDVAPPITLVAGGCGFGFHRGPYGGCLPNRAVVVAPVVVGRRCPPGFHLGPYRRACRPNF